LFYFELVSHIKMCLVKLNIIYIIILVNTYSILIIGLFIKMLDYIFDLQIKLSVLFLKIYFEHIYFYPPITNKNWSRGTVQKIE